MTGPSGDLDKKRTDSVNKPILKHFLKIQSSSINFMINFNEANESFIRLFLATEDDSRTRKRDIKSFFFDSTDDW